ncbi:DUF484 family protein [Sulfuricystis multivorans]|uniref:DUF484 family protein n=1 Tax=Sulfuricystis multivorans TaxID=2211108 RepID=UPI000F826D3A|nr:DUF484 family protein [Sulfuricystis multivorans]
MNLVAKDVAQYLKDHPDFFNQYAELLAQISIPDPHGGRAVSITERQIGALRDQVRRLEGKLAELLRFGEENDVLSAKTHRLAVALARCGDSASVFLVLYAHLGGGFAIPHVAVRLWDVPGNPEALEFQPVSAAAKDYVRELKYPYCGASSWADVEDWFGEDGKGVRSLAIVPLRDEETTFGMLALGSEEPERFYPGMGTVYLERIGELASAALTRTLA